MPVKLKIIGVHEFMEVQQDGRFDPEAAKQMLVDIAAAMPPPADYEILIDLRQAEWRLSGPEIWDVVAELAVHPDAFRERMALLTLPGTGFDHAERVEICARARGRKVQAFTNFEEAIRWLFEGAGLVASRPAA